MSDGQLPEANTVARAPGGRGGSERRIGDIDVLVTTRADAVARLREAVVARRGGVWGFANAHTVNMARTNPAFRAAVADATIFNDGVGVDLASRLLYGSTFPDNVNGTDFTPELLQVLPEGTPVFLLGSAPGVTEVAATNLERRFPNISVVGVQHGFFTGDEEWQVAARIVASGARLVLVGMGHPAQEIWAARNAGAIAAPLVCVGAFLDFAAENIPRAPRLIRKVRGEWLYRLALEPRRLGRRYLVGNLAFVGAVVRQRLRLRLRRS